MSHGKEHLKRKAFKRPRITGIEGADVTYWGRPFQMWAAATGKARSPTVDSRVRRTGSDDEEVERVLNRTELYQFHYCLSLFHLFICYYCTTGIRTGVFSCCRSTLSPRPSPPRMAFYFGRSRSRCRAFGSPRYLVDAGCQLPVPTAELADGLDWTYGAFYALFPPFRCRYSVAVSPFPLAVAVSAHRCCCRCRCVSVCLTERNFLT